MQDCFFNIRKQTWELIIDYICSWINNHNSITYKHVRRIKNYNAYLHYDYITKTLDANSEETIKEMWNNLYAKQWQLDDNNSK